ncbi:PQQ-binding-like beta-propeller repeat protein [Maioricimonas sp. JC845]|uniref:outer membrane protein assembly factor BamB family protein n=1 Tax=Maioricimonas sp. JC845 TaxID=3232138 RepID=UPI003459BFB7
MTSTQRALGILIMFAIAGQTSAGHWPQFRGPAADGIARSDCPLSWDSASNVRWKVPLAGEGWSCPVVWGDRVFLTAAVRTDQDADGASRPEPYRGGGGRQRSDLTEATYRWDVICLDANSGRPIWRQTARTGSPPLPRHSSNSYATETPVTDGERVYAYFGMTGLFCYDMAGELQWQKDLGSYRMRAGWGTSSSPVLFEGKLFLQVDNEEQSFLVALDSESGEEIWRENRPEPSQYSSPIIWQNSQRNEIIAGGQVCRAYHPETGKLLWQLDMSKGRSSATPLAVGDRLYIGTELRNRGGSDDGGGFLFAVKPGGNGDITPPDDATSGPFVDWKIKKSGIQMASPVLCEGHLYLLERRSGILHCVNAETGKTAYRTRIPGARAFWSSPWTSDGKVYCLADSGTTFVLDGGEEFEVLSENVIDEQCWSTPAIADGAIFLRTVDHLYCIEDGDR